MEEQKREQTKKLSIKEGSFYSIMDGVGLRFISPFALSLGASNNGIGIISSLPNLLGNFAQLLTHRAMNRYSRKKIVFLGVLLQALMWLSIIGVALAYFKLGFSSSTSTILLIIFYTLLITFGSFAGPAWYSWMNDIVITEKGKYFGKRSAITGFVALLAMLVAGWLLDKFELAHLALWGFAMLFSIAFLGRLVSAMLFKKHYEPKFKTSKEYYFSLWAFIKKMHSNNFGRFVIYVTLTSLTTSIAGPFFVVYVYKDLNFTNLYYSLYIIVGSLATLMFQPAWGKFADKFGNAKVLKICGGLVPLVPLSWLPLPTILTHASWLVLPFILLTQIFSGFAWAGFNLSTTNFIYDAVTRERMALCIAYFNIINSLGTFIGALIGGIIASSSLHFLGFTPILFVFFLSGISRFIVSSFMQSQFKEVRKISKEPARIKEVFKSMQIDKVGDFLGMRVFKNPKPF